MIEISTLIPTVSRATKNLFYYRNATNQVQIIRVEQIIPQRLEKIIFPGEQMLFYSTPQASFDIYGTTTRGLTLIDRILCSQLKVIEKEL